MSKKKAVKIEDSANDSASIDSAEASAPVVEKTAETKPIPTLAESLSGFQRGNLDAWVQRVKAIIEDDAKKPGTRELILAREAQVKALQEFQNWEAVEGKILNPKPKA